MSTPLAHVTVDIVGHPFLTIWSQEDNVVRAAGFATPTTSRERHPHAAAGVSGDLLWQRLQGSAPDLTARGIADAETADGSIPTALRAYAAGDVAAIDTLSVSQRETPFRREVWDALRTVEAGQAVTYSELADRAGRPAAVRAAASVCAVNLIALIIPCHRVVRADGSLGKYLFGRAIKDSLLAHEGAPRMLQARKRGPA